MIRSSVALCLSYIILSFIHKTEHDNQNKLSNNGFLVFYNASDRQVLASLPEGYQFMNYSLTLNSTTYNGFHRDQASTQSFLNSKFPIYTFITYLQAVNGTYPLLSVIPGSHKNYVLPVITTISGNYSTSILFNTELVHAGAISNLGDERLAIQRKIYHKKDYKYITNSNNLENFHGVINSQKESIYFDIFIRSLSIFYPATDLFHKLLNNNQINWISTNIIGKNVFY